MFANFFSQLDAAQIINHFPALNDAEKKKLLDYLRFKSPSVESDMGLTLLHDFIGDDFNTDKIGAFLALKRGEYDWARKFFRKLTYSYAEEKTGDKELKWSVYFQTPDYLERTRMTLILPEYEPLICAWCGLSDGSRVLDVGCGTGFFTRLLKRGNPKANLTGLEMAKNFVERAKIEAAAENLDIEFLQGDALALPFADGYFDLVVSHTFLTSISNPERSFSEMKRVLRHGGRIASVTAMNFNYQFGSLGEYPEECAWAKELQQLTNDIWTVYQKIAPISNYSGGLRPDQVPSFFAKQGMKNICAYPIGKLFSLSNNAFPVEQKERWLTLYQK